MNNHDRSYIIKRSGVLPHSFFSWKQGKACWEIFCSTKEGVFTICQSQADAELITACLNNYFLH